MSRAEETSRVAPSQAGEAEPEPGDAMMSPPGNPVAARKTGDVRTEPASVGPELFSTLSLCTGVSRVRSYVYLGRPKSM